MQNMDWLEEELGGFDDDYLIFDCPGTLYRYRISCGFVKSVVLSSRPNRALHPSSIPANSRSEPSKAEHSSMRHLFDRVTVHGRSL